MNSPHKGQWCRALMFSLICPWINCWVNNCEAGDLRRHHAHYDVIVMNFIKSLTCRKIARKFSLDGDTFVTNFPLPMVSWSFTHSSKNFRTQVTGKLSAHIQGLTTSWKKLSDLSTKFIPLFLKWKLALLQIKSEIISIIKKISNFKASFQATWYWKSCLHRQFPVAQGKDKIR